MHVSLQSACRPSSAKPHARTRKFVSWRKSGSLSLMVHAAVVLANPSVFACCPPSRSCGLRIRFPHRPTDASTAYLLSEFDAPPVEKCVFLHAHDCEPGLPQSYCVCVHFCECVPCTMTVNSTKNPEKPLEHAFAIQRRNGKHF